MYRRQHTRRVLTNDLSSRMRWDGLLIKKPGMFKRDYWRSEQQVNLRSNAEIRMKWSSSKKEAGKTPELDLMRLLLGSTSAAVNRTASAIELMNGLLNKGSNCTTRLSIRFNMAFKQDYFGHKERRYLYFSIPWILLLCGYHSCWYLCVLSVGLNNIFFKNQIWAVRMNKVIRIERFVHLINNNLIAQMIVCASWVFQNLREMADNLGNLGCFMDFWNIFVKTSRKKKEFWLNLMKYYSKPRKIFFIQG